MKKGTDWEDYVHYVYSTLLNLKGERIQVSKRTTFVLPSGETYEVDVYYEFWKAGVRHRVAIECKDWKSPVSQGQILEFHQKIKNIGNDLIGVVVSRNGYQDGAVKVAERHGMLALTEATFPTIPQLLASTSRPPLSTNPILSVSPSGALRSFTRALMGRATEPTMHFRLASHSIFPSLSPRGMRKRFGVRCLTAIGLVCSACPSTSFAR